MLIHLRKRRGLSVVVTSAMMLTFVAVLGTALVTWSNSNLKVFETSLATTTSNYTNQINENLNIENVAFCSTSTTCDGGVSSKPGVNVTLTNTGTLSVRVIKIQFNSTDYSKSTVNTSPAVVLPANILPQKSILLDISPLTWHSKSVSTITITTARGSIFTTQAAPP